MSQWMKVQPTHHQVAIAGIVSDAQTGEMIHRALVEMIQMPESFQQGLTLKAMQHGVQWANLPERPDRTYTTKDGTFYFIDLPDGDYTLQVSLPGAGTRYRTVQAAVKVARNQDLIQRATAAIALLPTSIRGIITNSDKEPIVMANVRVEGSSASTFSDSEGKYLLTGLEVWQRSPNRPADQPPKPLVTVSAPGYQPISQGVWLSQGDVKTLDFKLTKKVST
jgi:hypothetical protein